MKRFFIGLLILIYVLPSQGQENIGTPYSLYGLGLQPENNGPYTAMGGVSAAMRDKKNINYLNPASYTALDTMRFYFQAALTGEITWISIHKESSHYNVAQNANLTMALRLYKKLYMSFGFTEKSDVGYDILYSNMISGTTSNMLFNQNIQGEGGLNDIYAGFGWKYKNFSMGINFSYIFGKLEKRQSLAATMENSYYIRTSENRKLHDILFNPGFQYRLKLNPVSDLIIGTSFNFSQRLWAKKEFISYKVNPKNEMTMLDNETLKRGYIKYPFKIATGFNYQYKNKLQVACDYTFHKMSDYVEFGQRMNLKDAHKVALGFSWTPEEFGRFRRQRNTYMAGGYFSNSEVKLRDININTYGFTLGTQMPFMIQRTGDELLLGIALDFGVRGTEKDGLIQEKFAKLRINIAFKEFWFMKRKIN